jgi:hypothetical protein
LYGSDIVSINKTLMTNKVILVMSLFAF